MHIEITDFVAGARSARGLVVVIDVFRAFSLAAHAYARGVAAMIPVASIDDALELKRRHPDWLALGERHARPLPGFDGGNSPSDLERIDVRGRTVIHTTHAGTQGLTGAVCADEVIAGALVTAGAIVRYIRMRAPAVVTLVRMGHEAQERCVEDDRLRGIDCRTTARRRSRRRSHARAVAARAKRPEILRSCLRLGAASVISNCARRWTPSISCCCATIAARSPVLRRVDAPSEIL